MWIVLVFFLIQNSIAGGDLPKKNSVVRQVSRLDQLCIAVIIKNPILSKEYIDSLKVLPPLLKHTINQRPPTLISSMQLQDLPSSSRICQFFSNGYVIRKWLSSTIFFEPSLNRFFEDPYQYFFAENKALKIKDFPETDFVKLLLYEGDSADPRVCLGDMLEKACKHKHELAHKKIFQPKMNANGRFFAFAYQEQYSYFVSLYKIDKAFSFIERWPIGDEKDFWFNEAGDRFFIKIRSQEFNSGACLISCSFDQQGNITYFKHKFPIGSKERIFHIGEDQAILRSVFQDPYHQPAHIFDYSGEPQLKWCVFKSERDDEIAYSKGYLIVKRAEKVSFFDTINMIFPLAQYSQFTKQCKDIEYQKKLSQMTPSFSYSLPGLKSFHVKDGTLTYLVKEGKVLLFKQIMLVPLEENISLADSQYLDDVNIARFNIYYDRYGEYIADALRSLKLPMFKKRFLSPIEQRLKMAATSLILDNSLYYSYALIGRFNVDFSVKNALLFKKRFLSPIEQRLKMAATGLILDNSLYYSYALIGRFNNDFSVKNALLKASEKSIAVAQDHFKDLIMRQIGDE